MPQRWTRSAASRIGSPREARASAIASAGTPASMSAARVMSPLMPLNGSKWAARTKKPSGRRKFYGAGRFQARGSRSPAASAERPHAQDAGHGLLIVYQEEHD